MAAVFFTAGLLSIGRSGDSVTDLFFIMLLTIALLFRRTFPVASALTIYVTSLMQVLVTGTPLPINIVVLISLFSVTVYGPRPAGYAALGGALIGAWMFAVSLDGLGSLDTFLAIFVSTALASLIAWALGIIVRIRVKQTEAEQERKDAEAKALAKSAELAVAEERARIAREMHDIVAHSLAVIIAQADGGRYAAKASPEAGVQALETIAETGRDALANIRRILGVLRSDEVDAPLVEPQPTNQDIEELIERVRQVGASVAHSTLGEPRSLLPGMSLTIQRVCQEALTNALKHAGPGAKISVLTRWGQNEVMLQVDDDGRGAAASSDGLGTGLIGMRERAQLFGGQLTAGPLATGGFRVQLTLPLPKETP